jgi:hypothetical protein
MIISRECRRRRPAPAGAGYLQVGNAVGESLMTEPSLSTTLACTVKVAGGMRAAARALRNYAAGNSFQRLIR